MSKALLSQDINNVEPELYIIGHGKAGSEDIADEAGNLKSANDVANMDPLSGTTFILNSCYSAAPSRLPVDDAIEYMSHKITSNFKNNTSDFSFTRREMEPLVLSGKMKDIFPTDKTFAQNFKAALQAKMPFEGFGNFSYFGSPGALSIHSPLNTFDPTTKNISPGMAVVFKDNTQFMPYTREHLMQRI